MNRILVDVFKIVNIKQDSKRLINYKYIQDEKETTINVCLPLCCRPKPSSIIVEDNKEFVNGFKVVKTSNGEYGFVRESDNKLLSYRFDIALDFNKYGLAMIGKDGYVTWINEKFQFLNIYGKFVSYDDELLIWEPCFF